MFLKQISKLYEVRNNSSISYICKIETDIKNAVPIMFIFQEFRGSNILNIGIPERIKNETKLKRIQGLKKAWNYTNDETNIEIIQKQFNNILSNITDVLDYRHSWFFIYENDVDV